MLLARQRKECTPRGIDAGRLRPARRWPLVRPVRARLQSRRLATERCLAPVPNRILAARLAELGYNQTEFAEALNEVARSAGHRLDGASARYVRMLVSGAVRWPQAERRHAIEAVLRTSILDLGFILPGGRLAVGRGRDGRTLAGQDPPRRGKDETVDRRQVLALFGGAALTVTVPALPTGGRLGMADVARMREPLDELVAVDSRHGGGLRLAQVAVEQADRVHGVLERYTATDRVQRALSSVEGELWSLAGWFAIDDDHLDEAGTYLDRANRVATIAGNPMLTGHVWNCLAFRARQLGNHTEAYQIAKAALRTRAVGGNPRMSALFHARVAHGHAWRAERGLAERSLGRAFDALRRARDDEPVTPWLVFVDLDGAEIEGLAAMAYNILGRYGAAEQRARASIALTGDDYARNRVHSWLEVAEATLGQRRIEETAYAATRALELADTVQAGRLNRRFVELAGRLEHWRDVPDAELWLQRWQTHRHAEATAEPSP